jgi:wyosine [tRNA(Phe)-imidazoG37] synthetase (radical SAM superfamily)
LGIDLSPSHKQCNFDCLYCELAPSATTDKQTDTIEVKTIIDELKEHLDEKIDVVTITANGEPTLYPYLDKLINEINKLKNNTQTLILTNSATLVDEEVFNTLLKLDQVKLSLDAISEDIFKKIDRPHNNININNIIKKVQDFSQQFNGKLFIEILFVHGLNDTKDEIKKLNDTLNALHVQRVDIGTIDRPPAYPVKALDYNELYEISKLFDAQIPIHIASRSKQNKESSCYNTDDILNTLDKRPLTMDDIEILFDKQSKKRLELLLNKGIVIKKTIANLEFLILSENERRKRVK